MACSSLAASGQCKSSFLSPLILDPSVIVSFRHSYNILILPKSFKPSSKLGRDIDEIKSRYAGHESASRDNIRRVGNIQLDFSPLGLLLDEGAGYDRRQTLCADLLVLLPSFQLSGS